MKTSAAIAIASAALCGTFPAADARAIISARQVPPVDDAEQTSTDGTTYNIQFVNSCAQSVQVKYMAGQDAQPQIFATLNANGGSATWDSPNMPMADLVFTPYYAPQATCSVDCSQWASVLTSPRQGAEWLGTYAQYASMCNPTLSEYSPSIACCTPSSPYYDATTNDCPLTNDMLWGTRVEFNLAQPGTSNTDSFDISTNFNYPQSRSVFFNIPVSVTASTNSDQCTHTYHGVPNSNVPFPWGCATADCTTAYQSPTDVEGNGAQIQCPAQTSYTVTFCPAQF